MVKNINLGKISLYKKYINYTLYPLLILFLFLGGLYIYISHTNKKAEKLYNSGLKVLSDAIGKGDLDQQKLNKAIYMLEKLNKYPMTKYYKLCLPFLGYAYFLKGDYNKAEKFYNGFKKKIGNSSVEYSFLTHLAISSCYEGKNSLDKAIKILQRLCNDHPESPFREFALLGLERLYRLNNMPDKAEKVIQEFIKEYPQSPFFYMAKSHLLSYNNIKK